MDIRPIGNAAPQGPAVTIAKNTPGTGQIVIAAHPAAAQAETAVAVQQPSAAPNLKELEQAVQNINKTMLSLSQNLEFSIDKDTNKSVVKIIDKETKEIIRQLPSKETLEIAKALDKVQGLLIRQKA